VYYFDKIVQNTARVHAHFSTAQLGRRFGCHHGNETLINFTSSAYCRPVSYEVYVYDHTHTAGTTQCDRVLRLYWVKAAILLWTSTAEDVSWCQHIQETHQ